MADGAGTSYSVDEGYFSPQQRQRLDELACYEYERKLKERAASSKPVEVKEEK